MEIHKKLDATLCFRSRWRYSVVSEAELYGTSGCDISLYYLPCFWCQNYVFVNISLKAHVFSANVS